MTLNLRIPLVGFFLMVSLSGLAHAGAVVAIETPAVFGAPGSVVGWGITVTADPGTFPLFTGSVFSPDPNPAGTYIDYLALNFLYGLGGTTVTDSFDSSALSG